MQEKQNNHIKFNLSISLDRNHFLRRTCPSCGKDFKTETDIADLAWEVAPAFRQMGVEIGDEYLKEKSEAVHFYCPYCDNEAEAGDTLTSETINYLRRYVLREYIFPMTNNMFSGLEDIGRKSGGFITVRFEHNRSIYPLRPIHGPDPPDMKIIEFLCCGKKAKVTEQYNSVNKCIYCKTAVKLV